jgi:hypothetical protein
MPPACCGAGKDTPARADEEQRSMVTTMHPYTNFIESSANPLLRLLEQAASKNRVRTKFFPPAALFYSQEVSLPSRAVSVRFCIFLFLSACGAVSSRVITVFGVVIISFHQH